MIHRLFFASALAIGAMAQETATFTYSGPPLPINYSSSEFTIAEIVVSRALQISKVTVRVQVDYPRQEDLNVFTFSPFGTRTRLLERNCGTAPNVDTTFDDAAAVRFSVACPTAAGVGPFQGNEPLSNFNNQTSFGVWRLAVQNNRSQSLSGVLRGFSVTVTGTPQTQPILTADTILNGASGEGGALVPGELISIYGSGIGPATPVTAQAGQNLPNELGGVRVIIDGIAAPLLYVSSTQVEAQVPYAEIVGTLARIFVNYDGQNSPEATFLVQSALPGLYVSPGTKDVSAINQDGTINSANNPAPRGSTIALYCTGLGDTTLLIPAGVLAPLDQLIYTLFPVGASIGGSEAQVTFAGLAPGYAGLYQVNAVIPSGIGTGAQEVFVTAANGSSSQVGATIYVQ